MQQVVDDWRALAPLIVRPSGFALERLSRLRFGRTLAAIAAAARAAAERAAAGTTFDHELAQERFRDVAAFDDPAVRHRFSRHVKQARAFARGELAAEPAQSFAEVIGIVPRLAALAAELHARHADATTTTTALTACFATELDERRAALRGLFADDIRLCESVFLESPEAHQRIVQLIDHTGARDSRSRQRERLAAMYLQRFCAKNDTNSICGPHTLAWVSDEPRESRVAIPEGNEHRRTYFAHWGAEVILRRALERATELVLLRVNPMVRVIADRVALCTIEHDATTVFRRRYARVTLPEPGAKLLQLLVRPRTLVELRALAAAELALSADAVTELVDAMTEAGILLSTPALPPGLFDPLAAVHALLAPSPAEGARWGVEQVLRLRELVREFAGAALPERLTTYHRLVDSFREATGDAAERGHGQHYADRMLLHEDCHAPAHVELGTETIAPLVRAITPLLHAAALPFELVREQVRQWFRARFGEGRRVPALDVHRAFDEDDAAGYQTRSPLTERLDAAITRTRACFATAIAAATTGEARISAADLTTAVGDAVVKRPSYVSVDLMLTARRAMILGEVHGFFWLPTCLLDVAPEPGRTRAVDEMRRVMRELAGGRPTLECLFAHTQATDRRFAITDADLLLRDPSDRDAVPFGALDMILDGDVIRFYRNDTEVVPVSAYNTYPFIQYTSLLAPIVDDFAGKFFPDTLLPDSVRTADAPSLAIDELTFRRRTWRRPAADLQAILGPAKDVALLANAQDLRARLGCPAMVFVSFATEPKPVLLDFASFFLVEAFAHVLSKQPADARVSFSEMSPGADELFATAADGRRTCELRMGFYRL